MDVIMLSKAAALLKQMDAYQTGTIGSGPNDTFATVHLRIKDLESNATVAPVSKNIKMDFINGALDLVSRSSTNQTLQLSNQSSYYASNGEFVSTIIDLGESFVSVDGLTTSHSTTAASSITLLYQQGDSYNDAAFLGSWTTYTGSNNPSKRYMKFKYVLSNTIESPSAIVAEYNNVTSGNQFEANPYVTIDGNLSLKKSYSAVGVKSTVGSGNQFAITVDPSQFYGFIFTG